MGSAIGRTLVRKGTRVVASLAGRSERTARFAERAGIERLPDLDEVVRQADIVLSVAPPDRAEAIAADVAAAAARTSASPLVADLNAVSPQTARRMEATLAAAGLVLVDGSISGPPPRRRGGTRIYLSGREAARVAALPLPGVELILVGAEVGTASAVKMCTASFYKGSVALLAQALLTARAHGVVEHVLDDLKAGDPNIARKPALKVARATTKAERYVGEMREISATQEAAGLPPELFDAMAIVYARLAASRLAREHPEDLGGGLALDDVLDALG